MKNKNIKFGISHYWAPTPKIIRKIADSLLASAMLLSGFAYLTDYKKLALIVMLVAGGAKFISNLFTDDTQGPKEN